MKTLQIGDLKVKYPIVQGGMGVGVSLSGLAGAVANQGGIGVISAVAIGLIHNELEGNVKKRNREGFRLEIRKAREISPNGVIGANIMLAVTDFDALFKIALDEKLDIVFIGAGLLIKKPESVTLDEFLNTKTKIVPKISSARAANLIFKSWDEKFNRIPDAVVIEGVKAGGHLGFKKNQVVGKHETLEEILEGTKEIIKPYEEKYNIKVPIIVGGGIYDGYDIYNIMQKGADGVKMGTRFVTTEECDADIAFKIQYIKAKEEDVTIIDSPVGLPGRAIENDFIREVRAGVKKPVNCKYKCLKTCDYTKVSYCIAEALCNAAIGDLKNGFAFTGSNAFLADKIETVPEIFEKLKSEYQLSQKIIKKSKKELIVK